MHCPAPRDPVAHPPASTEAIISSSQTGDRARAEDAAFAELGRIVFGEQPLSDVLQRTAHLATDVLPLPVESSVTLIAGDDPTTAASSSELSREIDESQYAAGEGPCLACAEAGQRVWIRDIGAEQRWRHYALVAQRHGVRSSLAVPLPVQRQVVGSLNLYATTDDGFDDTSVALAERFAAYAAVAIANTTLYMSSAQLARQLEEALASRAVIEQAKGVLMCRHSCDADDAFQMLVRRSQTTHLKLRDVARAVVDEAVRS